MIRSGSRTAGSGCLSCRCGSWWSCWRSCRRGGCGYGCDGAGDYVAASVGTADTTCASVERCPECGREKSPPLRISWWREAAIPSGVVLLITVLIVIGVIRRPGRVPPLEYNPSREMVTRLKTVLQRFNVAWSMETIASELQRQTGIPVELRLPTGMDSEKTNVFPGYGCELQEALAALDHHPITWYESGSRIILTTADSMAQARTYYVADLLREQHAFRQSSGDLGRANTSLSTVLIEGSDATHWLGTGWLVTGSGARRRWPPGCGKLGIWGERVIVIQTPRNHDRIIAILQLLRGDPQVVYEIRRRGLKW